MQLSKLKRNIKKILLSTPHIKAKRKKYIEYIRSCYDYSQKPPTILCTTCMGGMLCHNLGLKFMSPTINLWLTASDLVKLVCNLQKYMSSEIVFQKNTSYDYPIGKIDDITIYFVHYHTEEDARNKWNERKLRIDTDNLYIIAEEKGLSAQDAERLLSFPSKRTVIFTATPKKDESYFCYECYKKSGKIGLYSLRDLSGFAPFEKEFNYAAWLTGKKNCRMIKE